jgi:hypothetical protein
MHNKSGKGCCKTLRKKAHRLPTEATEQGPPYDWTPLLQLTRKKRENQRDLRGELNPVFILDHDTPFHDIEPITDDFF